MAGTSNRLLTNLVASNALKNLLTLCTSEEEAYAGYDLYLGLGLANYRKEEATSASDIVLIPDADGNNFVEPDIFVTKDDYLVNTDVTGAVVTIDPLVYETKERVGITFVYSGTTWQKDQQDINLSEWGITFTTVGSPAAGNQVVVSTRKVIPQTHYARIPIMVHQEEGLSPMSLSTSVDGIVKNVENMQFTEAQEMWGNILYFGLFTTSSKATSPKPIMCGRLTDASGNDANPVFVEGTADYSNSGSESLPTTGDNRYEIEVDDYAFRKKTASEFREKRYIFTYNGVAWTYNSLPVMLSDYGVSYRTVGSPRAITSGDDIYVIPNITGSVVLFREENFKVTFDPVDPSTRRCMMIPTLKDRIMNQIFSTVDNKPETFPYIKDWKEKYYIGLGKKLDTGSVPSLDDNGRFVNFKEPVTDNLIECEGESNVDVIIPDTAIVTDPTATQETGNPKEYFPDMDVTLSIKAPLDSDNNPIAFLTRVTVVGSYNSVEVGKWVQEGANTHVWRRYGSPALPGQRPITQNNVNYDLTSGFTFDRASNIITVYLSEVGEAWKHVGEYHLTVTIEYLSGSVSYARKLLVEHLMDTYEDEEGNIHYSPYKPSSVFSDITEGTTYNTENIQFHEATTNWGNVLYFGIFNKDYDAPDGLGQTFPMMCGSLTDIDGVELDPSNPVSINGTVAQGVVPLFRDHQLKFGIDRSVVD